MTKKVLFGVCLAIGSLVLSGPVRAHHGDADRYVQQVISVTGTVVEVQMVNPHAHIMFDVTEGDKTVRWQAELGRAAAAYQAVRLDPEHREEGDKNHAHRQAVEERRPVSQPHRAREPRPDRQRQGNLQNGKLRPTATRAVEKGLARCSLGS